MRLISEQTKAVLLRQFSLGKGIRASARIAGVSHGTAQRYFRQLGEIPNCGCGLPSTHQGWCAVRFGSSKKRQEFMREWHEGTVSAAIDELCEWCFEAGRERKADSILAGVPLCSACSSNTSQSRFTEKKTDLYATEESATGPGRSIHVPKKEARPATQPKTKSEIAMAEAHRTFNPKLAVEKYKFCACGCGGMLAKDAVQNYLPNHTDEPKVALKTNQCSCGCGTAIAADSEWARGHKPRKPKAEVEVPTIERTERIVETRRKVTIIPSQDYPQTELRLTPAIAEAIWASLSKEQKYDILDTESIWREGYDDDMKMGALNKILLVHMEKS